MNYGPLEFAAYLRRSSRRGESATVRAARAAAPGAPQMSRLTVVTRTRSCAAATAGTANVYEAVALTAPRSEGAVTVRLQASSRPVVLVLSSHAAVRWQLHCAPDVVLAAVLLSGYGDSTVCGAGHALVTRIGGYYAFKRGSAEFRHLESEVRRCTGRAIESFTSQFAGREFNFG
jgi:hypothetical protein